MDRDIKAGNKALLAERDAREALEKAHDKKLKNLANSHAESSIHFGKEIGKLKGESDKASKRMDHLFNQIPTQKAPATPLPEVPKFVSPLQGTEVKDAIEKNLIQGSGTGRSTDMAAFYKLQDQIGKYQEKLKSARRHADAALKSGNQELYQKIIGNKKHKENMVKLGELQKALAKFHSLFRSFGTTRFYADTIYGPEIREYGVRQFSDGSVQAGWFVTRYM